MVDVIDNSAELGRISPYQSNESRALFTQQTNAMTHYFTYGVANALGEEPEDFTEMKGIQF